MISANNNGLEKPCERGSKIDTEHKICLEDVYLIRENELRGYIKSQDLNTGNDIQNRLICTILYYKSGYLNKEDNFYVTQPDFNRLYMLPIQELAAEAKELDINYSKRVNMFYLIRKILDVRYRINNILKDCRLSDDGKLLDAVMYKEIDINRLYKIKSGEKYDCYDIGTIYRWVVTGGKQTNPMTNMLLEGGEIEKINKEATRFEWDLKIKVGDSVKEIKVCSLATVEELFIMTGGLLNKKYTSFYEYSAENIYYLKQGQKELFKHWGETLEEVIDEKGVIDLVYMNTHQDTVSVIEYYDSIYIRLEDLYLPVDIIADKIKKYYTKLAYSDEIKLFEIFKPKYYKKYIAVV